MLHWNCAVQQDQEFNFLEVFSGMGRVSQRMPFDPNFIPPEHAEYCTGSNFENSMFD